MGKGKVDTKDRFLTLAALSASPAESRSMFVCAVLQGPHSVPSVKSTSQRLLLSPAEE
jgi:hypothetical protein